MRHRALMLAVTTVAVMYAWRPHVQPASPAGPAAGASPVVWLASTDPPAPTQAAPALAAEAHCQVTRPGQVALPADVADAVAERQIFGAGQNGEGLHGDGALWVGGLPRDGVAVIRPQGGEMGWKLGWWRRRAGTLQLEGRQLGESAAPLRALSHGSHGAGFQSSGFIFPTEGCWQITGRLDDQELTIVMRVVQGAMEPREVVDRFMQARLLRDEQLAPALLTERARASTDEEVLPATLLPANGACWYRYEIVAVWQSSAETAHARVHVYEHPRRDDRADSPPQSWEEEIRLVEEAFSGWLVDSLGEAGDRRPEPSEPRGSGLPACG